MTQLNLHLHEQCATQWALHICIYTLDVHGCPNHTTRYDTKYLLHISIRKEALCVWLDAMCKYIHTYHGVSKQQIRRTQSPSSWPVAPHEFTHLQPSHQYAVARKPRIPMKCPVENLFKTLSKYLKKFSQKSKLCQNSRSVCFQEFREMEEGIITILMTMGTTMTMVMITSMGMNMGTRRTVRSLLPW